MRTAVKLATVTAASTLALGLGTPLATAQAATTQNGLVNVSLTNTTIQVPVGVAANICNVSANVLTSLVGNQAAPCTAFATATATATAPAMQGGNTRQSGLINISATNTTVQVPIAIAANVCNIAVNVLATQVANGAATCRAVSSTSAH
jgi:hypothetical protein